MKYSKISSSKGHLSMTTQTYFAAGIAKNADATVSEETHLLRFFENFAFAQSIDDLNLRYSRA